MNTDRRTVRRVRDKQWFELEVELCDQGHGPELSICGAAGDVLTRAQAKRAAREYWESFFDECPSELGEMAKRFKRGFTVKSAARFVLQEDGELHGLDVHEEDDNRIYITHSCGQIREELLDYFPEVEPYLQWHLNNMHAECEHQQARGETYETHPGAVCPDCGYKLGSAWLRRELPQEVIDWFRSLPRLLDKPKREPAPAKLTLTPTGGGR